MVTTSQVPGAALAAGTVSRRRGCYTASAPFPVVSSGTSATPGEQEIPVGPRSGEGFSGRESQCKTEVAVGAVSIWQSCRFPRSGWTLLPGLRPREQTVPSCLFLLRVVLWGRDQQEKSWRHGRGLRSAGGAEVLLGFGRPVGLGGHRGSAPQGGCVPSA